MKALTLWQPWASLVAFGVKTVDSGGRTRDDPLRILPTIVNVSQQPYGDYSPGRFAWLLADIEALPDPIVARGGQRLWNWADPERKAAS